MQKPTCCRIKHGESFIRNLRLGIFIFLYCAPLLAQKKVSDNFLSHKWTDQASRNFQFMSIKKGAYAVAVAYTGCKSVCPMVSQQLMKIRKQVRNFPVYFISIDPENDNAKKRKAFIQKMGDAQNLNYLVSDLNSTRALLGELDMGFSNLKGSQHVTHSMTLALLNAKGEIIAVIPVLADSIDVAVQKILSVLEKSP